MYTGLVCVHDSGRSLTATGLYLGLEVQQQARVHDAIWQQHQPAQHGQV